MPNEEMMEILNLFFGKLIIQERGQGLQNITDNDDKYFQIERNRNFLCFMKYNFTNRKTLSASILTSYAMQEKKNCNINIVATKSKLLQPKINIKLKDFICEAELCTPKRIFKLLQSAFNDFFKNNFNYEKLRYKTVIESITNLILLSSELNKNENFLPMNFLIYSLYFLKDLKNDKNVK